MVNQIVQWLECYERTEDTIVLCGPPFMLYNVLGRLKKEAKSFDFGTRGAVQTGGGWKIQENVRIPHTDFREQVEKVLGIPETHCLDGYGMCEGNGLMVLCPEGHDFHVPYTYYKPPVLDDELMPMGHGEWGRSAFLGALPRAILVSLYQETEFGCLNTAPFVIGQAPCSSRRSIAPKAKRCVDVLRNYG